MKIPRITIIATCMFQDSGPHQVLDSEIVRNIFRKEFRTSCLAAIEHRDYKNERIIIHLRRPTKNANFDVRIA